MVHVTIMDMTTNNNKYMIKKDIPLEHNITGMVYKFPIRHPMPSVWLLEFA